ncbi:MAG: hypothetical protein NXI24_22975 [bacterium]|nr:hypothetical protein [bacterium]
MFFRIFVFRARFISCLACCLGGFALSQNIEAVSDAAGRTLIVSSRHAPFPHRARAGGHRYQNRYYAFRKHYADSSVLLYLAPGARLDRPLPIVVYLHGWRNEIRRANREFRLVEQFKASALPGLFVVPQLAREAEDSFGGRLEDAGGFDRLISDLLGQVAALASRAHGEAHTIIPGEIILAGHSGAYRPMAKIIAKPGANNRLAQKIRTIFLFDGLYGFEGGFAQWLRSGEDRRFVAVHTRYTRSGVSRLSRRLAQAPAIAFTRDNDDDDLPDIARRPATLLSSSGSHDESVFGRRQFERLLRQAAVRIAGR